MIRTRSTIEERPNELAELHKRVFGDMSTPKAAPARPSEPLDIDDQALIEKAMAASNGDKFRSLWDGNAGADHSVADLALCNLLAYWTGNDEQRIDRLFRQSGLMRDKWDEKRGAMTYGQRTIERAIDGTETVYDPAAYRNGNGKQVHTVHVSEDPPDFGPPPDYGDMEPPPAASAKAPNSLPINLTELGNARRLVKLHGRDLHYVHAWRKWFIWDGCRWAEDETGEIERRAKDTVASIYVEAANADEDNRKAIAKWALASESQKHINAMISLAQSEPGIPVSYEAFDADPMLYNCPNGTIDLRTGALRPHNRDDLITKMAGAPYDPNADCPLWLAFLDRIMDGNASLIEFLQRANGYSLTGDVSEQCLIFEHGNGRNGKTTYTEIQLTILGDYGQKAPTDMIMQKGSSGSVPNDVARLRGARMVVAAEVEEGKRLAESTVKDLTGGDTIVARYMRAEWFEFKPTHKLWIYGNHKPVIRGTDNGIWRRLHLIPFAVSIPESEQDPHLADKLKSELPGILAWAVRGCLAWQRQGLQPPDAVRAATTAYRAESDTLSAFLDECTVQVANAQTKASDLYNAYRTWCEDNGERPMNGTRFGRQLGERGFDKAKAGYVYYLGIGLSEDSLG